VGPALTASRSRFSDVTPGGEFHRTPGDPASALQYLPSPTPLLGGSVAILANLNFPNRRKMDAGETVSFPYNPAALCPSFTSGSMRYLREANSPSMSSTGGFARYRPDKLFPGRMLISMLSSRFAIDNVNKDFDRLYPVRFRDRLSSFARSSARYLPKLFPAFIFLKPYTVLRSLSEYIILGCAILTSSAFRALDQNLKSLNLQNRHLPDSFLRVNFLFPKFEIWKSFT